MLLGNRCGKTVCAGYELVSHLLGEYEPFWPGYRFDRPIRAWAAGDTAETTRNILQHELLGPVGAFGTGLIPKRALGRITQQRNVPDAVQGIHVIRRDGGRSVLQLKSFDQGRESFQGTSQDVIWLDEEPTLDIYTECVMRTMTTNGLVMCTFTPLLGLSDVVMTFMPGGRIPDDQVPCVGEMALAA